VEKEDIILECFVIKGPGIDCFSVIYLERGDLLKALVRNCVPNERAYLEFYSGENQHILSGKLLKAADQLAGLYGISPVHLVYPGGVKESLFIQGLREAKREKEIRSAHLNN
jgi:hypothetical protein